ncbi:NADH-quinone oxidoreductase subunit A [Microbulbifer thermotolerans]|uniref:NADH-quinone oxidoreductase subunit A n=1 Tax=Microbulbifer thermotolerans TaxID=252514 RepID=A0A143HNI4_MICTH|nr:NADH-quinone oxidoreductase subunit A [Microbulbifer thermotolerans]AMX03061.1 NADH:ubiquinone oxidoreductase subunit A [Microbulbifer thermotolerans]MCX2784236.1 NADH-quinone oxidoreductase subunit A [Microbulbifer thermotolerans]MCX2795701.1 NADH-quinone oxidoreductase subunit A [Microbulbifer thermotolerans]MCX2802057.1 NADH-quinone oxidoreductase subunit A [Microbulbifer thermotolerans]MCX2835330.1 NADH-quinone oxidoreductase subunit A [Microbulbifer thermotolerans]
MLNRPTQFDPATLVQHLWPLIVYGFAVLALIALMLGLSYFLGQRRRDAATDEPFESGIVSQGSAHVRLSINYYLVAILFIVFDLEAIYLFSWAIAFRQTGLLGFIEAAIFIVILLAGLIYLWRLGALDWGGKQQRNL